MKRAEKAARTTSSGKESYSIVLLLTYIVILVFRIPLGYIIGDNGNAYFGIANELFWVSAGMLSFGLSEAVTILIRFRLKRDQYKSSQMVLKNALLIGLVAGAFFILLFGLGGFVLAEKVFAMPLSGIAIATMSPSILFMIETNVFRGYFQGNGSLIPSKHSSIIYAIIYIAGGLIGASVMKEYGSKVSALLQNENHTAAYGAMGAAIGILVACVLCFLHMLILYVVFKREARHQRGREIVRNQDNSFHIIYLLGATGFFYLLVWIVFNSYTLIDQLMYFQLQSESENSIDVWGMFYGKYQVLIEIPCLIIILIFLSSVRRIIALFEREDYRIVRERLGILIHQCAAITFPVAVFIAVFAENIVNLMWAGTNKQTIACLQLGSVTIILISFTALFFDIIQRIKKSRGVLIIASIALLVRIVTNTLLLLNTDLGVMSLIIGNIVSFLIMAGIGFWLLSSMLQYRQEWIRCFAITLVAAALSGVIATLLNKVFTSFLGSFISLLISLVIAIVCYVIFLVIGRSFSEEEMYNMSGGRLLLIISSWFPFL